jgi:mannose-6-phosphate isomerase-like protein (cupin superfamily)
MVYRLPVSATPRTTWTVLASGSQTNDRFELFEERRPTGGGPAPHVHRGREEAFYVIEGRYRFWRADEELEVGPGGVVLVPRGTRHWFRALGDPCRTLIVVSPPGLEGFFRRMAEMIDAGRDPLDAMTELSKAFDSVPMP